MTSKKAKWDVTPVVCPTCDSRNFLYRKRDKTYWCRKCGQEWKMIAGGKIRRLARSTFYPND